MENKDLDNFTSADIWKKLFSWHSLAVRGRAGWIFRWMYRVHMWKRTALRHMTRHKIRQSLRRKSQMLWL